MTSKLNRILFHGVERLLFIRRKFHTIREFIDQNLKPRTINCLANKKTRYQMAYDEHVPTTTACIPEHGSQSTNHHLFSLSFRGYYEFGRFKSSGKRILWHNNALWCIFVRRNSRPMQLCSWLCHRDDNRLIFCDLIRNWHLQEIRFLHIFLLRFHCLFSLKINWKWKYARLRRVHSIFCCHKLRLFRNLAKKQLQNRMPLVS